MISGTSVYLNQKLTGSADELEIIKKIGNFSLSVRQKEINHLISSVVKQKLEALLKEKWEENEILPKEYYEIERGFKEIDLIYFWNDLNLPSTVHNLPEIFFRRPALKENSFVYDCVINCRCIQLAKTLCSLDLNRDLLREGYDAVKETLAESDNLELLDYYASQGFPLQFDVHIKIFSIVVPPTIQLKQPSLKKSFSLHRFLSYPHIAAALKIFMEKNASCQKTILPAFVHYLDKRDVSTISFLLSLKKYAIHPKTVSAHIKKTILLGYHELLDELLSHCQLFNFSEKKQKELMSLALKIAIPEVEWTLIRNGFSITSEDRLLAERHREWFGGGSDKKFLAFKNYVLPDRSLHSNHKKIYGGDSTQNIFQSEMRKSIQYVLLWIYDLKNSPSQVISFKELLLGLGFRRQRTAYITGTSKPAIFGVPLQDTLLTPLRGTYFSYQSRAQNWKNVSFSLDNKTYTFTKLIGPLLHHIYANFWKEGDPLYLFLELLYKKIALATYENTDQLKEDIATFHWLFANIVPFERGSCAIGEVLTDALWLFHGYIPGQIETGKSLDLEAMFSHTSRDFIAIYPSGKKYSE